MKNEILIKQNTIAINENVVINKININTRIITLRHYIKSRQFVLTDISPAPTGRSHLKLCLIFGNILLYAEFPHHRCKCAERHKSGQSSSCSSPERLYKHSEAPAGVWADVNARNLENKRPVEAAPPGSLTEGFLLIYEGEINVQQHDRLKSHLCFDFYVFYCISLHQFCSFYSNTPFSATTVPSANQGEFGTFPTASFTTFAPP